jgi:hypothetical protein
VGPWVVDATFSQLLLLVVRLHYYGTHYYRRPDLIATIMKPIYCMRRPYTLLPTFIQIALHLAHILVEFRTLTLIDWAHHVLSSLLVGVLNLYYTYGPLLNYAMCTVFVLEHDFALEDAIEIHAFAPLEALAYM